MHAEVQALTSLITALEALSTAEQPKAPPREEEGRAKGHDERPVFQGASSMGKSLDFTLTNGEKHTLKTAYSEYDISEHEHKKSSCLNQYHDNRDYKLPKIDFPKFDGEHPRVWREKCEKYFHMYNVPVHVWVSFATINFRGNTELWLQTYEAQHSILTWPELCVAVEEKFGQDLHHNYMRDFLTIKQNSDVLEYASRFEKAKHRVLLHNKHIGEVFFVQKFLDGLKYSISNALTLHKPRMVDAALSLALMQEEIVEASSRRFSSRSRDYTRNSGKHSPTTFHTTTPAVLGSSPLPDKSLTASAPKPKWDSKLSALQTQRRKMGLCIKCGDKWGRNHTCPAQIPLHIMEELWDAVHVA
jgi:hypothetical protein